MNTERPTPETDARHELLLSDILRLLREQFTKSEHNDFGLRRAYIIGLNDGHDHARRLERERDKLREQLRLANEDSERLADQIEKYAQHFPLTTEDNKALAAHQARIKGETRR